MSTMITTYLSISVTLNLYNYTQVAGLTVRATLSIEPSSSPPPLAAVECTNSTVKLNAY